MNGFLKKIVRPTLKKAGLYDYSYQKFFTVRDQYFQLTNKLKKRFTKTAVILTYHRVDIVENDPHLLCVTPSNFDNHLKFYKENYEVIPLLELIVRLRNDSLTGHEAVITLDDGYQDNLTNALPLLEKHNLPATIFVTTGFLGEEANQPWDQEYAKNDRAKFLSPEQVRSLSINPLVTLGAHTHTHPRLAKISSAEQLAELKSSRNLLETLTGQNIELFAYPFGGIFDFTNKTKALVNNAGFIAACTTIPKLVTCKSKLDTLPRFNIRNYSTETLRNLLFCTK